MGEVTERKICRLCLKLVCKNDYEIVEEKLVMSKTIYVNLNWRISENPIICSACSEELQKFDDFKSSCLTAEEHIKCAAKDKLGAVDLWQIEYGNRQTPLEQNQICRFCLKLIKGDKYFKLNEKDVPLMLQKCIPELALSMVREPVICKSCLYVLEGMFRFVTSCLRVEEIINNYRDYSGPNVNVKINLYDVLQFSKIKKESDSDKIPVEEFMYDDKFEEAVVKSEKAEDEEFQVKSEISVKDEPLVYERELEHSVKNDTEGMFRFVTSCSGVDETINNYHDTKGLNVNDKENLYKVLPFTKFKEKSDSDEMSVEKLMDDNEFQEAAVQSDKVEDEELQVKSEFSLKDEPWGFENELKHSVKNKDVELKSETHLKLEEGVVMMQSRITTELNEQRMLNVDEELLGPRAKQEFRKKRNKMSTYRCEYCSFHTKYEGNIKLHVLTHKKSSEETIHKCDFCLYRTKNKYRLKDHLVLHMEPPETTVYKCYSCSYHTKHKGNFKRHVPTHRDPSAVKTYKCASCSHETKRKSNLRIHMLAHKVSSEVTMHKCDSCLYQTKYAFHLKTHLLKHKDPSEVTMYKCNSCSYQTLQASYLKRHLLQHKDPSEVTMHKCDSCSFQTKYASCLKTHVLRHMDPSEVTMHKCNSCSYQTKHASNLKTHLLNHKDPSEVKV